MKFCKKKNEVDMLKTIIIIICYYYTLNNFTTHMKNIIIHNGYIYKFFFKI
jgi:hypothetical protein